MNRPTLVTVDIAHPPLKTEDAELELDRRLRDPNAAALKIVHGYGSRGKGGVLKEVVLQWTYRRRDRIQAVIEGNDLGVTNPIVESLIKSIGTSDPDLLRANDGITVIWIR